MVENNQPQGGIKARKIQANNVVSGVQIQGGDAQQNAVFLVNLAQSIRRGEISADEINALDVVVGLQYISEPSKVTTEDVRKEVAALLTKVNEAIAAHEIPKQGDAKDAQTSLQSAEEELASTQPDGERVVHKLDEANRILTKSAEMAQSASSLVAKLAPIAAAVWAIARRHFGL